MTNAALRGMGFLDHVRVILKVAKGIMDTRDDDFWLLAFPWLEMAGIFQKTSSQMSRQKMQRTPEALDEHEDPKTLLERMVAGSFRASMLSFFDKKLCLS